MKQSIAICVAITKNSRYIVELTMSSKLVGCVSLGSPPKRLKEDVETMRFKIHNFASIEKQRDEYVVTPAIQSHGYQWRLAVYPRGVESSPKDVQYVSVYLQYCTEAEVDADADADINNKD